MTMFERCESRQEKTGATSLRPYKEVLRVAWSTESHHHRRLRLTNLIIAAKATNPRGTTTEKVVKDDDQEAEKIEMIRGQKSYQGPEADHK